MDSRIQEDLKRSWASLFYELVFCQIDENKFASLYSSDTGRPNFPVNVLLSLEFIKHMKNYTDEELIEQFRFNYLIMYAVGIRNLGESYFAPRTLYEFRERIYNYTKAHPEEEDIIFSQFNALTDNFLKITGLKTEEQRSDSTEIVPNIKKGGRLSLAFDVLISAVKSIEEDILPDFIKAVLEPDFRTQILFRSKGREAKSRLENLLNLSLDFINYLKSIGKGKQVREIEILKRFLSEQTRFDESKNCLIVKENKEISSSSLQSAYDEDITYRKKRDKGSSGYVLNLAETCSKDNKVQLITDYTLKKNNVADIDMLIERLPIIVERTGVRDVYIDGGYYSERLEEVAEKLGVKLHYTNMTGKKIKHCKLPFTSFEIESNQTVISCPAGQRPLSSHFNKKNNLIFAEFDREECNKCPLKDICRVEIRKKKSLLRIPRKSLRAAEIRAKIESKQEHKESVSKRAAIEGTNSSLKRTQGIGKLKVCGLIKSTLAVGMKIIGHNFRRVTDFFRKTKEVFSRIPVPHIEQGISLRICECK
jgi:hypothetical protein